MKFFAAFLVALAALATSEARPQDALQACKSKTIVARFQGGLKECFRFFAATEPKPETAALQKQLMIALERLEEIENLLDDEETILKEATKTGVTAKRSKRDLERILSFIGIGGTGGTGGGLPDIGQLLRGVLGGEGAGDSSILSIVKRAKQSIKEIIGNLVNLIFGTVGEAANGVVDTFGLGNA